MAICAWLAAEDAGRPGMREQVEAVCDRVSLPVARLVQRLRRLDDRRGPRVEQQQDWTRRVERTWELCDARVRRLGLHWLARWIDARQALFLDNFTTLFEAYRSGAMHYGCIVARAPTRAPTTTSDT